jgi:hypothetical protein
LSDLQKELQIREDSTNRLKLENEALKQDQTSQHLKSVVQSLEEEI